MEFSQSVLSVITSDKPSSPTPHTLTWGEDHKNEDDNTENETNDRDEGKDDEQQDEDNNEQLHLELTTNHNSSTKKIMEPASETTWTEQDQNTDDEKDDERFWKDLEAYEDTSSDEKETKVIWAETMNSTKRTPFITQSKKKRSVEIV